MGWEASRSGRGCRVRGGCRGQGEEEGLEQNCPSFVGQH